MKKKMFLIVLTLVFSVLTATAVFSGTAGAKSLYTIAAINGNPTPIEAYDIQVNGSLVFQAAYGVPYYAGGAVGIGIDSDSATLFVTYEFTNVIQLLDATTMADLGTTTAPGASNLAGIVMDQDKGLLYTVDRWTDDLYTYQWYPSNTTLVLKSTQNLADTPSSFGIALDEINDILYVANYYSSVMYYDTDTWAKLGEFTVSHYPQGIAVDAANQLVYTGSGWGGYTLLSKYDLGAATETTSDIGQGVMGLAIDPATNLLYGNIGYGIGPASTIRVFDSDLSQLFSTSFDYHSPSPTGLCIPGKDISYNPLNLTKDDGFEEGECINSGGDINYTIYFDNGLNDFDIYNVTLLDTLPVNVSFVDASDSGSYDSVNHTVIWELGTILSGEGDCIWLLVQVDPSTSPGAIITNYVTIDSDETPPTTQSEETLVCEETEDTTPPVQTVEFGEPKISTEWYGVVYNVVSCSTPIWINSTDPGGVGSSHINYSMWRADDPYPQPNGVIAFTKLYEKTVYDGDPEDIDPDYGEITVLEFTQQSCIHEILYECWDYENNTDGQRDADFIADCCGPETLKEIGQPQYGGDYPNWVSDETPLWFNSTDKCCLPNGTAVSHIVIEVWWKSNFSDPQEPYQYNKTVTVYDGDPEDDNAEDGRISYEFHFDDSCCHELRWYGVDIFGNIEAMNKQKHKVDVDPPEIIKTVGDPNCEIVAEKEYCITPDTPITFYAEDRGCMGGVGLDTVEFNIWYQGEWTGWISLEELEGEPLYLTEECTHYLLIRATDLLGNEIEDNETFYVDNTTPTIDKIVGLPNCYITEGEYCVTTDTNITINASDLGCCDSLFVDYRVHNYSFDSGWIPIGQLLPYNFSFTEECYHNLDIRAYDCLGHIVYDNETFHVDDTPPIIEKTVGDPNCVIIDGEEYCITPQTPITINASNNGCCVNPCLYVEYQINDGNWTPVIDLPTDIYIGEECNHTLTIRAWDCLGNMAEDVELFHVDNTTPTIEKTVGDPNCTLNCKSLKLPSSSVTMVVQHWGANSYFDTTLSVVPFGYDIANGDYLGWCVDENNSISSGVDYSVDLWCSYDPLMPWPDDDWDMVNYLINHKNSSASKEDIQDAIWYFVDGEYYPADPEAAAMVDDALANGEGFMPSIGEWCAILCDAGEGIQKTFIEVLVPDRYCVTTDTNITLDAVDLGCCPSLITIEYRIWNITDGWSAWIEYIDEFSFEEECEHYLEVRAYDCLENGINIIDNETFYVDDTPPEIIKIVGDPNCTGCGEMGDDDYCVTTDTFITLEAVELGCCPSEVVTIEYKIGDGNWIEYIEPFNFTEECEHILLVRAYDCLGNGMDEMYWDNETFYVDDTPPEIIKIVGDPNCTGCGEMGDDDYCVTTDTNITLDAVDLGCCPCTNVTIEYKIGDGNWIEYIEPFNFTEECEHILYVRAYDCLGNGLDCGCWDIETFYVDDTPPPKPEKIVGDPKVKLEDDSMGHDQWMIFPETEINFTAIGDDGCCPCEEVTVEYRIWYLGTWTDWMIYTGNITLSGGCVHYLEARAYDCLGNRGEIDNETFWVCTPGGDVGPDIMIIDPEFGSTHCERILDVKINASDDATSWEDLDVQLWIPGGRRDAPTLWYEPVYNESDGLFHAFIDLYKYQDGAQITLEALAIDEDYNVEFAVPVAFTVCSTTIWDQWMQEGWNLLILPPNIGCNESVERVLSSIDGSYDWVFYNDPDDGWSSYSPDLDPVYVTLTEIQGGRQYWVHITNADGIRYYIGLPEIEILAPEDEAILTELDEINGYAWNSQDGIDEVNLLIYYKDELNSKYYWNGTDWADTSYNLLCQLDDFDEHYNQDWLYDSSGVEWICDETFYIKAIATDEFGCLVIDQVSFNYTCVTECIPSKTYTLDADFDEGTLVGLEHETVHDQLQLIPGEVSTYPTLWVANAGEDSLSKWDTENNKELARYHTWFGPLGDHDAWDGPAPSRTCVDTDGNCYVANRDFDYETPDVIKIYADDWIDRNGDGVLNTSYDANGNGTIEPSEMLPMTDLDFDGIIDPDEIVDERIAWAVQVGSGGVGRSLAIDLEGNIWLGIHETGQYYKLSSVNGSILGGPYDVTGGDYWHTPYGALVDKYGYLWGSSLSSNILKMNTSNPADYTTYYVPDTYGIALGYDSLGNTLVYCGGNCPWVVFNSSSETYSSPASGICTLGIATDSEGNIVGGDWGDGSVAKFAPNGTTIWNVSGQVYSEVRGIVVDSDDNIWTVHRDTSKICKYNGTDGAHLGVYDSGLYPYTYSDATGIGLMSSVVVGTWDVVFDSEAADTQWDVVNWTSYEPENTSLTVEVRSSNDQVAWSPWETVANGIPLGSTPVGQYLQIEVTMKIMARDESPILYDLTVEATCAD